MSQYWSDAHYTQYAPQNQCIDSSDPNNILIGYARPGVKTSENGWAIKRVKSDDTITWANGNAGFIFKWNDRANYDYSV